MNKRWLLITVVIWGIGLGSSYAGGLGFYGALAGSSMNLEMDYDAETYYWDEDWDEDWDGVDEEYDVGRLGLGFVWDTCPARDLLVNYRLEAGFHSTVLERTDIDFDDEHISFSDKKLEGYGITINNSIGFGVVRKANLRFWLGPAVRLFYERVDLEDKFDEDDDWISEDTELAVIGMGLGPVLGVNFRVGTAMMLSFSGGISFNTVFASSDLRFHYDEDREEYYSDASAEGVGSETMIYLRFSTLFLSGDDRM